MVKLIEVFDFVMGEQRMERVLKLRSWVTLSRYA